jgi:putative MATE family efflux protein
MFHVGPAKSSNLVSEPVASALLLFALPTLLSSVLQSLGGSINTIWVGHLIGETALAATSNANLIMFLMSAGVFGFGMAATILVGQSFGRGDLDGARRAMGAATTLFVLVSTSLAIIGWFASPRLLNTLATPVEAMPLALTYLRVSFLAIPATFALVLLMMGLRGAGDSVTPVWFMALSVLFDAGLNPLLILGWGPIPGMGIGGSATALVISDYVCLAALVAYIYARDLPLRLRGSELAYLVPEPALIATIFTKGLPMGLQMMVVSTSALAMMGLVNAEGIATTAAFGVASQLWTYIQMPAMAIGAAVSAMAAQNIGAGQWDRVGEIAKWGLAYSVVTTSAFVGLLAIVDQAALQVFLPAGSAALPIAMHINLIVSWGFILFGASMVLFGVVRANGAVVIPLLILVVAMFGFRFGGATILKPLIGVDALWWSFPLGSAASLAMATAYYRFGSWREARMASTPGTFDTHHHSLTPVEQAGARLCAPCGPHVPRASVAASRRQPN